MSTVLKISNNPIFEIWGDGVQTRSFCYIDDITYGIHKLIRSDYHQPLNMGRDRMVSINELADIVADVAGVEISKKHIEGPEGVRGRNSDNTRCKEILGWAPETSLEEGFAKTYPWIESQLMDKINQSGYSSEEMAHSKIIVDEGE